MQINKIFIRISLAITVSFIYSVSLIAQELSVKTDVVLKKQSDEKTEIISVKGQKPLGLYREEMVRFRFEFFDMLNALNNKPEFEIKCEKKSTIKSRIKRTICEPQYAIDMRIELNQQKSRAAQFNGGAKTQTSEKELNTRLKRWHERANQEKLKLIFSNANLKEQFLKLVKAEKNYKRLHVDAYGSMSNYYEELSVDEKNN
ncbi:MAG: hypothetical protein ACI936_001992 [Paraglaciecola sp.]|jgi:hypothetical protein